MVWFLPATTAKYIVLLWITQKHSRWGKHHSKSCFVYYTKFWYFLFWFVLPIPTQATHKFSQSGLEESSELYVSDIVNARCEYFKRGVKVQDKYMSILEGIFRCLWAAANAEQARVGSICELLVQSWWCCHVCRLVSLNLKKNWKQNEHREPRFAF